MSRAGWKRRRSELDRVFMDFAIHAGVLVAVALVPYAAFFLDHGGTPVAATLNFGSSLTPSSASSSPSSSSGSPSPTCSSPLSTHEPLPSATSAFDCVCSGGGTQSAVEASFGFGGSYIARSKSTLDWIYEMRNVKRWFFKVDLDWILAVTNDL